MNNLKYFFLMLSMAFPFRGFAQTVDDIGKIVIGVEFQEGCSQETQNVKSQLEDKLIHFATQAGCSSFDNKTFFISPNVVINSLDIAEGGMKNVYIARGDLFLTIQDRNSGVVFSSMSFPFSGTATKKELAIKNGILSIKYDNISSVFTEAKSKILSYYQNRIDLFFIRANTLAANEDYDGAITCLMMIPEDLTNLHKQALIKAQDIFAMRDEAMRQQMISEQKEYNDSILTTANSYLAMHQPDAALSVLSAYAPGDTQQDAMYRNYVSQAEKIVSVEEREAKRKEEREYQENRRREDRAYREYSKQAAHNRSMDRQKMALQRQVVSASERIAHHRLRVDEQKTNALKQVACDYIRNNPNNIDYIRVKF